MRHTRLISAAVGAVFVAGAATGCSSDDVKNAANSKLNEAKASAGAKASEIAASATAKAGEVAGSAGADAVARATQKAADLLQQLSPATQKKLDEAVAAPGVQADLGSFEGEPTATVAEEFLAARQAALATGDLSAVDAIATPQMAKRAQRFVRKNKKRAGKPFQIRIVGVTDDGTQVCIGPKGQRARVVVTDVAGKVARITKGTHTCA